MNNPFAKAYRRIYWLASRPLCAIFRLEVAGWANVPQEPVLLCGNHASAWDPIFLLMALPRDYPFRIMAKKQLFKVPVLGKFLTSLGVFPVDRGNSDINAIKTAIRSLREGFSLILFPEGTRVKHKGQVQPKAGAAMMAIRSGVKMVPFFVGRTKRKVKVIFGKPYTPVYSGRNGTAEEYQSNTDEVLRQCYELGGL